MSSSAINQSVFSAKVSNIQNAADTSSIYSAGAWDFKNASAVTSVKIDASGNVGIGVVTPASYYLPNLVVNSAGNTGISIIGGASSIGALSFGKGTGVNVGDNSNRGKIWYDFSGDSLNFSTAGSLLTPSMRIDASGNLLVGATSPLATERLGVFGSSQYTVIGRNNRNTSGDVATYFEMGANTNNTASYFINCSTTGVGTKFYVYGNGTYGTVSDINLKKNIETARDGYLQDLCKLRVVKYNWKTDKDEAPKELGWIAQELEQVFPGLVQDSEPNTEGIVVKEVKSSVLPFMLLKAIQELSAKVDTQAAEIEALKAK